MESESREPLLLAVCRGRSARYLFAAGIASIVFGAFAAGLWGMVAAILLLTGLMVVVPNLPLALLLFIFCSPHLGEPDLNYILSRLWMPPFFLLAAAWSVAAVTRPRKVYMDPILLTLYVFFLLVCVFSILTGAGAEACPPGLRESGDFWFNTRETLMATVVMVFAMAACRSNKDLTRVFWAILIPGIPLAITLFFFGKDAELVGETNRRWGIYYTSHSAGVHMLLSAVAAVTLLRVEKRRMLRILLLAALLLFLVGQHLTYTRTTQAAVPVVILCAVALEFGLRRAFLSACGLTIALLALFPFFPVSLRSSTVTILAAVFGRAAPAIHHYSAGGAKLISFFGRLEHLKVGLDLSRQYPFFGLGMGRHHWVVVLKDAPRIHNYFMVQLVEIGIIGFLLTMAIIIYGLILGWLRIRRARREGEMTLLYLTEGLVLSVVAILVVFMATPGHATGERYLWPLIGLLAARMRQAGKERPPPETENTR